MLTKFSIRQFREFHRELFSQKGNQSSPIVIQSYGTLIYDLNRELHLPEVHSEEFETIPILIEILRKKNKEVNRILIENPDSFSDIYLIFDLVLIFVKYSEKTKQVEEKLSSMLSFLVKVLKKGNC